MKRAVFIFAIILQSAIAIHLYAQEKTVNLLDSARAYYEKKDYKKAFDFYETYHVNPTRGTNNIDTYWAAVAACHVNNIERVRFYLKYSAEIGYEIPDYKRYELDSAGFCLHDLPEWKKYMSIFKFKSDSLVAAHAKITSNINDTTKRANQSLLLDRKYWKELASKSSASQLISKIKQFDNYPSIKKNDFWTLYHLKVNDTLTIPFLVHIPKTYHPKQKTPLYVYLHGAIVNRSKFVPPEYVINQSEIKIMDKAIEQNAFIIYPFGKRDFGWLYQQLAFETVLNEISYVKSLYNINDNKVYIGGHSNGGSGAFWFAMKQPSPFAAAFGLNYLPKVYSSNTPFANLRNEVPFLGISGTEDPVFSLDLVNGIYKYATTNGANWQNFSKKGNHSLPFSSRDSVNFIFDLLATKTRNPFPKKIEWETDNVKNGRNAWIEITQLDTLAEKASWHVALNPTLTQNGKTGLSDFNRNKSGAVIATVEGNTINIQTSSVKSVRLYISPDMFDLSKQVKITINNKDFLNVKLDADKQTILDEFLKTKDRDFIVATKIDLTIK
jgi:predicted esterase